MTGYETECFKGHLNNYRFKDGILSVNYEDDQTRHFNIDGEDSDRREKIIEQIEEANWIVGEEEVGRRTVYAVSFLNKERGKEDLLERFKRLIGLDGERLEDSLMSGEFPEEYREIITIARGHCRDRLKRKRGDERLEKVVAIHPKE